MEGGGVVSRPDQTAQTLQHEGAKDTNALIDSEGTTFDVKAAVSFGAGKDRGLGRAGFEIGDELFEFPVASEGVKAPTKANPAGKTMAEDSFTGSAWHQSVVEGLAAAPGTQVGSEGVKAPVVVLTGANDYGFTEGNDQPCRCDTEARIGGKMHLEDISLGIRGDA
jgi:predicted heme/steroid binding protein